MRFFITILLILFCSIANAQSKLTIQGPTNVGLNEIVELSTNIDMSFENDLPSHTIMWEVPTILEGKTKSYNKDSILVLSSGCKDADIIVRVVVIDWENRRMDRAAFTVKVRTDPNNPIPPPGPIFPPAKVTGKYYDVSMTCLNEIKPNDNTFVNQTNRLEKSFGVIIGEIRNKKFTSIESMLAALRQSNNNGWDASSRVKWQTWRSKIADLFISDQFQTIDEFISPLEQIQTALKEVMP